MHGWSCRKVRARVWAGLAASALIAGLIVAGPGEALAAGQAWRLADSPNATLAGGRIDSVSCSSASACTAVGGYLDTAGINVTLAERWNGKTWRLQFPPNPDEDTAPAVSPELLGVSCPTASFCEAVGSYELGTTTVSMADAWNGRGWTRQSVPFPAGSTSAGFDQVSCTSARFCEAVGSYVGLGGTLPLAATWNGTSWRLAYPSVPAGATFVTLSTVSCASATFCEAWGSGNSANPGPTVAERWNGTSWHLQGVPANAAVNSVSCVAASFCEAVGATSAGVVDAAVWNGSSWAAQTAPDLTGTLAGVSCTSAEFCEAVGDYYDDGNVVGQAADWTGTAWLAQPTPNPASSTFTQLNSVSCASTASCEMAGYFEVAVTASAPEALAEGWNGQSWARQHAVAPAAATSNSLDDVSCVSASFCEAVGSHSNSSGNAVGLAESWNGRSWKIQATPNPTSPYAPTSGTLFSVSCVSASFCEAVGVGAAGAYAEMWNGTSWSLQTRPGAAVQGESVSCTATNFCMAIDAEELVSIWNGSSWSAGTSLTGFSPASSVSCVSASLCEAVGAGPAGENAAVWNGSTWSAQTTGGPTGVFLSAISCTTANACEAVGTYPNSSFQQVPLAETWNGSTWAVQSMPNPSISQDTSLLGISCTSADACTAVGQYQYSNLTLFQTLAEVWNGDKWTLRSTPNVPNTGQNILNGVSCGAPAECIAVGLTEDAGLVPATLVETGD
jgi:hypothetical protein